MTSDEDGTTSSSDSSSDVDEKIRDKLRKLKKKIKREERKAEKLLKRKLKKEKKKLKKAKRKSSRESAPVEVPQAVTVAPEKTSNIPISLMEKSKVMAPMSKEEWEKRQSVIRKVLDEESGRYRLIKGDGEVLEELVPLKKHKEINRQATEADGAYFQMVLSNKPLHKTKRE